MMFINVDQTFHLVKSFHELCMGVSSIIKLFLFVGRGMFQKNKSYPIGYYSSPPTLQPIEKMTFPCDFQQGIHDNFVSGLVL